MERAFASPHVATNTDYIQVNESAFSLSDTGRTPSVRYVERAVETEYDFRNLAGQTNRALKNRRLPAQMPATVGLVTAIEGQDGEALHRSSWMSNVNCACNDVSFRARNLRLSDSNPGAR